MSTKKDNGNHDEAGEFRADQAAAAASLRDAAGDAAREIKDRIETIADDLREKATGWQKELEQYVRKNPTKSVLTAVGVGFVLGVICRR